MRTISWWISAVAVAAVALAAWAISPFDVQQALEAQLQAALEYPDNPRVFNDLGNLWMMAGELEPAEEAYRRALALDPDQASAQYNLGLLLQQAGRYREALKQYQAVLRLNPRDAWSHYQIGTLYAHWRDSPRAIDHYARAFSLDPELAFPEVNPHVIENRFKTEALLKAHKEILAAPLAPRAYEEPVRIGALLIPPVPAGTENGETEEALAEAPVEEDEGPGPRRLTTGDLDPHAPSNQATPQGVNRRGAAYRPPPGSTSSRASRYERLRRMQQRDRTTSPSREEASGSSPSTPPPRQRQEADGRPTVIVPQGSTAGPNSGGDATSGEGEGRNLAPSSSRPVRPGTSSTGRLDIELIPRDASASTPVTLASVRGAG